MTPQHIRRESKVTVMSAMMAFATVLGPYWIAPYIITSTHVEVSPVLQSLCVMVHTLG